MGSKKGNYETTEVDESPSRKRRRMLILKTIGVLFLLGIFIMVSFVAYFSWDLPSMDSLQNFRPPVTSEVYSADHVKIGEFSRERRIFVPLEQMPPNVAEAFIAAEDAEFYEHRGISPTGILRAFIKNLQAGRVKQGGSTITQQVAKSLLLSPERSYTRKAREAILAFKMERNLTKEEILEIYLNQIYLGRGAYGVQAAAQTYFAKDIGEMKLPEIAVLAGLTKAPARDNPIKNLKAALKRQVYVLGRMEEEEFISEEEKQDAIDAGIPLVARTPINLRYAPYFVEQVRRDLMDRYGGDKILEGGLQIYTTAYAKASQAAEEALQTGLEDLDKRQGYRGPLKTYPEEEWPSVVEELTEELQDPRQVQGRERFRALISDIDDKNGWTSVNLGVVQGIIPLETMKWAREPDPEKYWEAHLIDRPSEALEVGDLVYVRPLSEEGRKDLKQDVPKEAMLFTLEQIPVVQGALISMDPSNGAVRAMVGGYDFRKSEFNRTLQARRQPGSAFKPIIYSAALDHGYTPASMILDSAIVYEDSTTGFRWTPKNFSGKFYGDTVFREALIRSRNVPTVKIVRDIGIDRVIERARKLSIESPLARDDSLSLGSSAVKPVEIASAYSVFAAGGRKVEPVFIEKVVDRDGNVLERSLYDDPSLPLTEQAQVASMELTRAKAKLKAIEAGADPEKELPSGYAISPQTAYIMTHLLTEVVTSGTGRRVLALGRPAAGKTGTTNDNNDAWFVGFTPNLVAAVWVGFDETSRLGVREVGSRAASPIWLSYMQKALEGMPTMDFSAPEGIVFAQIDPKTGTLATKRTTKPVFEAFREGTVPSENADEAEKKRSSQDFFLQE